MKSSKIVFRLFLPFFLASLIFVSSQTFAQDNQDAENRDILDYSDAELVQQAQAQEEEKKPSRKKPSNKEKRKFFNNPPEVKFTGDFSMDIIADNFIFSGFSYMLGADIDRFVSVGVRLSFPMVGAMDRGKQFRRFIAIAGGAIQIETAFSLINFFVPDFTVIDVEIFLRGGAILGATIFSFLPDEYYDDLGFVYRRYGIRYDPRSPFFSFYHKPTFTLGLNLLFFEKVYLYAGMDFGDAIGSRPRLPTFIAPVGGLAFKF